MRLNPTREPTAGGSGLSKRFYSEKEIAIYAGLAVRTLQAWRFRSVKGAPPWVKLCGAVRYDIKAFEQWLAGQPGSGGAA